VKCEYAVPAIDCTWTSQVPSSVENAGDVGVAVGSGDGLPSGDGVPALRWRPCLGAAVGVGGTVGMLLASLGSGTTLGNTVGVASGT
jgi:hypothetical protein